MKRWVISAAVIGLLAPGAAHAEPAAQSFEAGAVVHAGLGTPLGYYGVGVEGTFSDTVRVEAGVGRGAEGNQYSVMATWLVAAKRRLGIGVGSSMGAYRWDELAGVDCDDFCDARAWDNAKWVNLELSYRYRFQSDWQLGPYAGVSFLINPGDVTCPPVEGGCGQDGDGERLVFVGLAFGRMF